MRPDSDWTDETDDKRSAGGREVVRERLDQPCRHQASVRSSIQREIMPGVRVPLLRTGRQVRGVRDDAVESTETPCEVRANHLDLEPLLLSAFPQPTEGDGIEVRRDHAGPSAGGLERRPTRSGADLEKGTTPCDASERHEEESVLAGRVHGFRGGPGAGARTFPFGTCVMPEIRSYCMPP